MTWGIDVANLAQLFQATKSESTLLVLYIPSGDRDENPIDQASWVTASLKMLGSLFGGATAFPQGRGVWRDDARSGLLIFDEPTLIQCYTTEELIDQQLDAVRDFVIQMGRATKQGAVGIVIDREYYEIRLGEHS